jgi:hypothetical protein
MKPNPVPLIAAWLLCFSSLQAQDDTRYTVQLKSGSFIPEKNITTEKLDAISQRALRTADKTFALIQFEKIPAEADKQLLKQAGIELLDYIPNNSYTVTITGRLSEAVLQQTHARAIVELSAEQKMEPLLSRGIFPAWAVKVPGTVDVWISFPKTFSFEAVSKELQQRNMDVTGTVYKNYRVISLRIAAQRLTELASLPFIEYVQPVPHGDQTLIHHSVPNGRANVMNSSLPGGRNLKGQGVVIGIGDNADPLQHIDFNNRIINRAAIAGNSHGVHVNGIAGGGGIVWERFTGYAPKSTIIAQAFSNIITYAPAYVQDHGMVITNNSYGDIVNDCNYHGVYDLTSRILDQQALDLPELQHVFAAGNSGNNNCPPYVPGFRNVLGGYQSAKNVISVGTTEENSTIRPGSSKGPTRDGRLKPEITAQGSPVASTVPTHSYAFNSGTSMAAPAVAGGLALLYERYRQLNSGANPKSGLMKALLCNGGRDLGNSGPDFSHGFGWMNLLRSVEMLENNNYKIDSVANGATKTETISVPANTAQLKVMLYWNDPPASVLASQTLVNDLDLKVVDLVPDTVLPKILDTIPGNVTAVAVPGEDHINNVEQVTINNPAAGDYTAVIKGTAVTQNPMQPYFLVYDIIPVTTTLTHPIGGEKFDPGDSIYISWDSYGDPENTFTIEYSLNNGGSWTTINDNVAANLRQLKWFVPNTATHEALVRITRNSTAMVSTSQPFTILGVAGISLSAVQCEGYISVDWTTVNDATDYEVMMLRGEEMVAVGTTTSTTYIISGLSKDSVYWVSVRPRYNGSPGRRAYATSRQPNSGTCSGTISDNDLKTDAILAPVSGRKFTSNTLSAATTISARMKNLDDAAVNNFNMKYSVNGGGWVTEAVSTTVNGGATYTHNFAATYDFSATGIYTLRVVVENTSASDPVPLNDTMTIVIKHLDNPVMDLSSDYLEDFESAPVQSFNTPQTGLTGLDKFDFKNSTSLGRIRSFVNTGIAFSGAKALTLDMERFSGGGNIDSLTGTFNLSMYDAAADDVRLDFRFKNHGQLSHAANKVWIRGDDMQPWIEAYDLFANQNDPDGSFKLSSSIELSDLLAANSQNFSSSFQVRWGQWGQILTADNTGGAGYTFDDVHLYLVTDDIQMLSIDTPVVASCALNSATPVKVTVRNSANSAINNIPVKFSVDGGAPVSETISSIAANSTVQYTFTATADLSALGTHTIKAWVDYSSDSFRDNDTAVVHLVNSPLITSFPYLENFESGAGSWYSSGKNSSWEYGTPASPKINRAASGSKAWKTMLTGNYNNREASYLYSPCFDVSGMTNPTLSFSVALDLEDCGAGTFCDGAFVEYSADGITWSKLGTTGTGTNWYNRNYSGHHVWSVQNYTRWHVATAALPTGLNNLRLRFAVSSDPFVTREGMAVDDIHIYDNTMGIYDGITLSSPVTENISGGSNWIDFISGGKLIASVQPNNQNMGSTDAQVYIHTGAVRNNSGQYYHNRNITIKPTNRNLSDSAIVRFYFLDSETEALINATGCSLCTKPTMAYELGVSKYTDADFNFENGTLADNQQGVWHYIHAAQAVKVPFDKGYYAEFRVKDFSEFWLNDGGLSKSQPLPLKLISFTAKKQPNRDVLLEWVTADEVDVDRYEIEVARGNDDYNRSLFSKIGTTVSRGNSPQQQYYRFTDVELHKTGVRYYRLKMIDLDGSFRYSPVRPVIFNDEFTWQLYPNPSAGIVNLVLQAGQHEKLGIKIYDVKGKLVRQYETTATGFQQKIIIDLSDRIYPPGLYFIKAESGERSEVFRLVKQ